MTITETIAALEKIKAEHGDIRVTQFWAGTGDEVNDVSPKVAHVAIPQGRETVKRYVSSLWKPGDSWYRKPGEKVVRI